MAAVDTGGVLTCELSQKAMPQRGKGRGHPMAHSRKPAHFPSAGPVFALPHEPCDSIQCPRWQRLVPNEPMLRVSSNSARGSFLKSLRSLQVSGWRKYLSKGFSLSGTFQQGMGSVLTEARTLQMGKKGDSPGLASFIHPFTQVTSVEHLLPVCCLLNLERFLPSD